MLTNDYTGIVESAVRRLIFSRTSRFRLRPPEVDDLQQRIVLALLDFRFNGARSNGATATTAITGLIDRQIKAYLRAEGRYHAHLAELAVVTELISLPEPSDMRMAHRKCHAWVVGFRPGGLHGPG